MRNIKCTHCGSTEVRPSTQDIASRRFTVYRCRACKDHFKVRTGPRLPVPVTITLLLVLIVALAWAGILLFGDTIDEFRNPGITSIDQR